MKQRLPAKRTTGWTSNLLAAAGDVLVPLLFAFGVGSIFSLICGCNPFTLYSYIIKKAFFSVGGLLNTLGYTTPIIITGMATALSIRANMYNMGIEGQVFLGAFTAALAGYMIKGVPTALHVTLCLLIGAAFGAVNGVCFGILLCWALQFAGPVIGRDTLAHTALAKALQAIDVLTLGVGV